MIGPILYSLAREAAKSPTLWQKAAEKAMLAAAGILGVAAAEGVVHGVRNLCGNEQGTGPQANQRRWREGQRVM